MANVAKKKDTPKGKRFEVVNPNAAGIDISPKELQVCVPSDRTTESNRKFGVYTKDLHEISAWLKSCKIDTVAMESTGIYWLPIYRVLTEDGFDVILVNAHDVKNFSGRKTDASDAEWLMMLHSYGLLSSCYLLDNMLREIRDLVRLRSTHIRDASRAVLHLQKAMEQMNLKLDNVFSDILGKSGQTIIHKILKGERDPKKLASLADPRCKKSKEEIEESLRATWDEQHLFAMKQSDETYRFYQRLISECDEKINEIVERYKQEEKLELPEFKRSEKARSKTNKISFDIEKASFEIWGINAMNIPGINEGSLLKLLSELGRDFTNKFPTVSHFLSWANLVPNNKISGGSLLSSKVPKKKNPVGIIFRECANSLKQAKNTFGDYFRHMKAKGGHFYSLVATGNKIARIFYFLVKNKVEYDENIYTEKRKNTLKKKLLFLRRRMGVMEKELFDLG